MSQCNHLISCSECYRVVKELQAQVAELTKQRDDARKIGLYWQGVAEYRDEIIEGAS